MKRILGLDLGTSSIGWALVNEAEDGEQAPSSIEKLGVRIIQFDTFTNAEGQEIKGNPADYFCTGKSVSPNASRTKARSMRRNLQRYKLRRSALVKALREAGIIGGDTVLNESGPQTTHQTLFLRAKAATEEISLGEFARVLLNLNKKRGYKSSRKEKSQEDGTVIDGMAIARELFEKGMTPGEYVFERILKENYFIPDFYKSDLQLEFDKVWEAQRTFYPDVLTANLKAELEGKNKSQTWAICQKPFKIEGVRRAFKGKELVRENYRLRTEALHSRIDLENLAVVLQEINGQIKNTSGLLGSISDRSKELHFNKITVGQYLWELIGKNPHTSLKNIVFLRKDYMDEFEQLWETQSRFHKELTPELQKRIRDIIIFYQRPLKSQKGLVGLCEFEKRTVTVKVDGKEKIRTVGLKVCPKSSPLFQEFKIWQVLNNLKVNGKPLEQSDKETLFTELSIRGRMSDKDVLRLLYRNPKDLRLNFKSVEGNDTQAALFKAYSTIIANTGHNEFDFSKLPAGESMSTVTDIFNSLGWKTDFLHFDSGLEGPAFEAQPMFRLWHLLYSYEGDKSLSGNAKLVEKLMELTGMDEDNAKILASVTFGQDYGSLSSKAMRKILPYMKEGNEYSLACGYAGYRHSAKSLTKEELLKKEYSDHIAILPKNSLRNPLVEKILNQMANVVNEITDTYGKPDEIRIELARELKKSADERKEMADAISKVTAQHEEFISVLKKEFNIPNPSRNDLIRYKLYLELKDNGFHTLYSNTYIPQEKLFSKEFDIEHIIPQAKLFDDSFSNKTLEARQINLEKSDKTAFDFVSGKYGEEGLSDYSARVEKLFKDGAISRTKRNKLLMREADIPQGFIERDLRDTQYISRKAKEMLEEVVPYVVSTTGSVTDRLREDWQLVDVMRELNWDKFEKLGMTHYESDRDGRQIPKIDGWSKRNDHRHHAMDALTIAFTRRSYIQYLNNLNARVPKWVDDGARVNLDDFGIGDIPHSQRSSVVMFIERNRMERDSKGKLRFIPPMPLKEFRNEAKARLSEILVSIKSSGKVVTKNVNKTRKKGGCNKRVQLTPRGQLHNETIYGRILQPVYKEEKVGPAFGYEKIATVVGKRIREALKMRLDAFNGDAKKAFGGKNSLDKNPVYIGQEETVPAKVRTMTYEEVFTKREAISPNIKIDKVIDGRIRQLLEERLKAFGNEAKKAFSNLEENPIWLDRERGIQIKSVTLNGKNNVVPLHDKRDNSGSFITDKDGRKVPTDYVSTGNNHHITIYRDADGNLQEQVVSFYEAVARINDGSPVIDRDFKKTEGWEFLFSMKRNEYFVFPNPETGFDPSEIDLLDPENYALISPNLFRVQKLATRDYVFRHHLETTVANNSSSLKDIIWKRISAIGMNGAIKVRINHLGEIVHIGE